MGGSNSKAAEPIVPPQASAVAEPTASGTTHYEVKGAGHSIVVHDTPLDDPRDPRDRYRPASKEALAFREATNVGSEKVIGVGGDSNAPYNRQTKVLVKDSREYIIEHEGLMVGEERRRQLSRQWWFALSSEPLQRGLDAGLILGAITAGGLVGFKKQYRTQPIKVAFFSVLGFCVGCMSVPLSVIYLDTRNAEKIRARDRATQQEAREEYLQQRRNN